MSAILVSACLLGVACRYDGGGAQWPPVLALIKRHRLIPVCPEQLGGLPTPRVPDEILNGRVLGSDGSDNTEAFVRGAHEVLRLAELLGCRYAVLKERSPSCGSGTIYDGSFSHTFVEGDGVTAQLLKKNGIQVFGESDIPQLEALLQTE